MQLETKHDYSAVEQALAQNEAPAKMRIMVGHGLRALAIGIAVSTVILSAGYAAQMVMNKEPAVPQPVEQVELPDPPTRTSEDNPIIRQYVIFESVEADMIRDNLSVVVGHNYASSKQGTYDEAYCYASEISNGAQTRVDLSTKLPDASPTLVAGNAARLGLTNEDMKELRALCPYL